MQSNNSKEPIQIQINDNLPVIFVDHLNVITRADGLSLIRLLSLFPEGLKEQARIMVPQQSLRTMLDVLCAHSNYYPKKPRRDKAPAAK